MAKGKSKEMGVVMRYEAGRKNRRVGKKLTLCEQRGELFSWERLCRRALIGFEEPLFRSGCRELSVFPEVNSAVGGYFRF